MKKILVMPDGNYLAHVSRTFEIAKVLRDMGYHVIFASDGEYMKIPIDAGFDVITSVYTSPVERTINIGRSGRADFYNFDILKKSFEADLEIFDEVKPDMVLGDFRLSLSTSCEYSKIPFAVTLNGAWTDYYTAKRKATEHISITRVLGKSLAEYLMPYILNFLITSCTKPYNKLRKHLGLIPKKNLWDVFKGDLNLITDIPEYAPTENLPENYHYIGPIVWEPDMLLPDWHKSIDPNKFTIYITMGSTGNGEMFHHAVDVFGNTEYQCIMTLAGLTEIDQITDNFYIADYIPGNQLLEKCCIDVIICHGGNGTVYQAMSAGVPVIGIPTLPDQDFNLGRVEDMGFGIFLSHYKFKPYHLKDAVDEIKFNKNHKENACKYQKIVENYGRAQKGAELIDKFLI